MTLIPMLGPPGVHGAYPHPLLGPPGVSGAYLPPRPPCSVIPGVRCSHAPPPCPVSPGVHCAHPSTPCLVPPGSAVLSPMLGSRPRGPWCLPQCSVPPGVGGTHSPCSVALTLPPMLRAPRVGGAHSPCSVPRGLWRLPPTPTMLSLPRVREAHTCAQSLQGRWCSPPSRAWSLWGRASPPAPCSVPPKKHSTGVEEKVQVGAPAWGWTGEHTGTQPSWSWSGHPRSGGGDRRWGSPTICAS